MKRTTKIITALVIVGILVALFLSIGPPKLLAKSSDPGFCSGCHVMDSEYEAWMHAGAHRRSKCVDCHLPNENKGMHYAWKTIDGLKDALVFYSGRVPEQIRLTSHAGEVLQANCVRCHEETVSHIDKERRCWECHRRLMHKRTGAMQTI